MSDLAQFYFYAEMPESHTSKKATKTQPAWTQAEIKRAALLGKHINCMAVFKDRNLSTVRDGELIRDCIGTVQAIPNGCVCLTGASQAYLATRATRIDRETARELHPALFAYLEA